MMERPETPQNSLWFPIKRDRPNGDLRNGDLWTSDISRE
jgi:hypothetical protein